MAAPASTPRRVLCALLLTSLLLAGCQRAERDDLTRQVEQLKAELEQARLARTDAEKSLSAQHEELVVTTTSLDAAKAGLAEKQDALTQRDTQLRAAQAEIDSFKKRDTLVYGEARVLQQQGRNIIALGRYQQFLKDFPGSPLAPVVTSAIAELNADSQREQQRWAEMTDPRRKERELLGFFRDGLLSPQEIAPLVKRKTRAQVIALLGKPSHVFPDGAEIGYSEKSTNPANGRRGMLIITFDAAGVAALRVDYAGQKIIP